MPEDSRRFLTLTWVNTYRHDPELTSQKAGREPFGFAQGRLWATEPVDSIDSPSYADGHGSPFHPQA